MSKGKGWHGEPKRHSDAARGIPSGSKKRRAKGPTRDELDAMAEKLKVSSVTAPARPKTKFVTVTETAKLIRKDLKTAFPGVKFSVRSSSYSMGSSIDVFWLDGPSQHAVENTIQEYSRVDRDQFGNILRGGNRYVFAKRDYTPESKKKIEDAVRKKFAKPTDFQGERFLEDEVWRTLQQSDLPNRQKTRR